MARVQSAAARSAPRPRRAGGLRYLAARFAMGATDAKTAPAFVLWFALLHAVLWTVILTSLKAAQDVHMDVAEAYGWGQQFLLGYGKHPPLSGWLAGLWFKLFPVQDWSTYALAMATLGVSLVICWHIAVRVVDRRRAFLTVVMLAIYPIFNFKGFKYNADLLQLVTLPLIVLAYLHAFERRDVRSGLWLGLAALAGMMTKYWAITVIGGVGLAALAHPDRLRFIASPAPWVALVTLLVGFIPHLWWLVQVHFAPIVYAGDIYEISSRTLSLQLALTYIGHNIGLLVPAVLAGLLALGWMPFRPRAAVPAGAGVNLAQARNVWMILAIVGFVPPIAGAILTIHIKTDWGIPLFFLGPLAFIALPQLRVQRIALIRLAAIWLAMTLVFAILSPWLAAYNLKPTASVGSTSIPASQLAQQLTEAWHQRFRSRWPVVAGTMEVAAPMTFYSPDHPVTLMQGEAWGSGLTSLDEAKRDGFIGICDTGDNRLPACEEWMATNAPNAEQLNMSSRRFFRGVSGPLVRWKIYIMPPAVLAK
ncbi:glycosyltransferase family 39 protein [Bradyrhizobium prioriisuperbiae]|uniref:glycosyltransferase family 39 protein n=1 Tax=Bradyrhizobium prioriisuperbiae TaxID=2854389 RepID=UPI0028EB062B|nr:glycosyltransferase family 39 protein [Bradyrhizobium prioritasuperba]